MENDEKVYAIKYPVAFHTVDVAITRQIKTDAPPRIGICCPSCGRIIKKVDNLDLVPPSIKCDTCELDEAEKFQFTRPELLANVRDVHEKSYEVLLIQKKSELDGTFWRFPGGFVDPELDDSAEHAAKREAVEEVGEFETDKPKYIGSFKIDDPRYRTSAHKIITSFFELKYMWGKEAAGDDAAKCEWKSIAELKADASLRNPIHEQLFQSLFKIYAS